MEIGLTKIKSLIPTLATRENLAGLESKLFSAFQQFSTTAHQDLNCMRQDISDLRAEMTDLHKEMSEVHKEIADVHKGMSVLHDQITSMAAAIHTQTWKITSTITGVLVSLFTGAFFIAKYVN
jgi:septal ring factor EnvC (AmiA/AmiB activator)